MPIQHLNLTAYLVRKTSDNQGEYGVFKESKEKLRKVRKVIKNSNTSGDYVICKESKEKFGKLGKLSQPLIIQENTGCVRKVRKT